jgi:hypothetical protein
MSKIRRSIVILASAMALATGAVILTTHAADQGSPPVGAQPTRTAATSTPIPPSAATPSVAKPAATKPPAPGAPQVPEESATLRDDPTIAPDPKQSADNNVSFPNDI